MSLGRAYCKKSDVYLLTAHSQINLVYCWLFVFTHTENACWANYASVRSLSYFKLNVDIFISTFSLQPYHERDPSRDWHIPPAATTQVHVGTQARIPPLQSRRMKRAWTPPSTNNKVRNTKDNSRLKPICLWSQMHAVAFVVCGVTESTLEWDGHVCQHQRQRKKWKNPQSKY